MSILRFDGMDDLVEKANNTMYGLAAAVVTKSVIVGAISWITLVFVCRDLDKALDVANNIRAGTVW